ncbi:type VI secretion protein, partial [Vibrio sp. S512-13]
IDTPISPNTGPNGIASEGTLIFPLATIPSTDMGIDQAYAYWEYQQAIELERLVEDKRRERVDQGAIELSRITQTVKSTSDGFYQSLLADLEFATGAFNEVSQRLDDAVGAETPRSYISKRIESIH